MGGPPCQGYSGMNRFNKSNWSLVQNSMVGTGGGGRGGGEEGRRGYALGGIGMLGEATQLYVMCPSASLNPQNAPHPRPPRAGHVVPVVLRVLPPPLLPAGERAQLREPQQELHVPPDPAHAAGDGLPGVCVCTYGGGFTLCCPSCWGWETNIGSCISIPTLMYRIQLLHRTNASP